MDALDRKGEDRRRGVDLTGPQDGRGEARLIRGVWEVLGLQCDAIPLPVGASTGADQRAVEIAAAVELNTRLGRPERQGATAVGIAQGGDLDQRRVRGRAVEYHVVVI